MITGRYTLKRTGEPIGTINFQLIITPELALRYAAECYEVEDDKLYTIGDRRRLRISKQNLDAAIKADFSANGDRMDWDFDEESWDAAISEVKRLYPEWAEWIDRAAQ